MKIILENETDYKDVCGLYGLLIATQTTNSLIESSIMMDRITRQVKQILNEYKGEINE